MGMPAGGPQLDVGAALGYGWKKFTENTGAFIVLTLAVLVAIVGLVAIQTILTWDAGFFVTFIVQTAITVAIWIVLAGVWRAGLGVTRGETPSVDMLTRTDNIVPYILTSIIVSIVASIGFFLCFLPGLIWLVLTSFASLHALDKGTDPIESIKASINAVTANAGRVILILIASWVVYFLGAVACLVGLLVTIPVALVSITYTYRLVNNEPVAP